MGFWLRIAVPKVGEVDPNLLKWTPFALRPVPFKLAPLKLVPFKLVPFRIRPFSLRFFSVAVVAGRLPPVGYANELDR
jgi:hypothetical protein